MAMPTIREASPSRASAGRGVVTRSAPGTVAPGDRFGRLTVESTHGKDQRDRVVWACRCDCGGRTLAKTYELRGGRRASCGCDRRGGDDDRTVIALRLVALLRSAPAGVGMRALCNSLRRGPKTVQAALDGMAKAGWPTVRDGRSIRLCSPPEHVVVEVTDRHVATKAGRPPAVVAVDGRDYTMTELCALAGITRQAFWKRCKRYGSRETAVRWIIAVARAAGRIGPGPGPAGTPAAPAQK